MPKTIKHEIETWYGGEYVKVADLPEFEQRIRDDEARRAADDVEALPYLDHGRTVNRNDAIIAARRGLRR
jgi:hypothetical protein